MRQHVEQLAFRGKLKEPTVRPVVTTPAEEDARLLEQANPARERYLDDESALRGAS